jgi:hypothetical protein
MQLDIDILETFRQIYLQLISFQDYVDLSLDMNRGTNIYLWLQHEDYC